MLVVTKLNLQNYNVSVTFDDSKMQDIELVVSSVFELDNPREIVSVIESIATVESVVVNDSETDEVILSSGLLKSIE